MINKKLDDIIEDIITLKKIFNSTDYFKTLEKVIDKQNNHNKELELKINNLQSKIDKVNELLEERKEEVEDISWVEMKVEDYIEEINEIENILKEDK